MLKKIFVLIALCVPVIVCAAPEKKKELIYAVVSIAKCASA